MEPLSSDDPRAVGEFRLRARLGAGGMGRVYLGRSPAGRAVAVKVVHPELARDAEFIGRFRSEVAAAQAVNGIYTAQVVAAGLYDTPPWLATAYVPGPTLQQLVDERGSLPEQAVWRLAGGLAEALQAVHGAGLVHRDLKPNNVLIAEDGPRVIDFGVSRALDGASATRTGLTFGTPPFMSPEQAKGQAVGAPSDVFSLGSVLCFAVTGHPPFGDGNAPAVLYRVVHEEPALDGVRGALLDLITGCLAKQAADRPTLPQIVASLAARTDGWDGRFWPAGVLGVIRDYVGIDLNGLASTPVPARQSAIGPLTGARDATHGSFAAAPTSTQLAAPAARTVSPAVSPAVQPAPSSARPDPSSARPDPSSARPDPSPSRPDPSPSRPDPSPSRPEPSAAGPAPGISRRRMLAIAGGAGGVIVAGSVTGWALDRPGPKAAASTSSDTGSRHVAKAGTLRWQSAGVSTSLAAAVGAGVVALKTGGSHLSAYSTAAGGYLWDNLSLGVEVVQAQDDMVFATGWDGPFRVLGLDGTTGKQVWSASCNPDIPRMAVGGGLCVVPSATSRAAVVAYDVNSGEQVWTFAFPDRDGTQPGDIAAGDGVFYVAGTGNRIWRINTSGHLLAQFTVPAPNPFPLKVSGDVLFGIGNGVSYGKPYSLYAADGSTGQNLWTIPLYWNDGADTAGTMAVGDDNVYVADTTSDGIRSTLTARNARTGKTAWRKSWAGNAAAGTPLAFGTRGPGVAGTVLIGIEQTVCALNAATGRELWQRTLTGPISAITVDGTVAYASTSVITASTSTGHLYAIQL